MSDETELAEVKAAISASMTAKRWKHGDDEAEMPDLKELEARESRLEAKIARKSRGPRVTGVSIGHN